MSISNDYFNVADWVGGHARRNQPIVPREAAHLAQVLADLADRVRHLERVPLRLDSPEVQLGFHELRRERHDAE
jgi:hypothetical protein